MATLPARNVEEVPPFIQGSVGAVDMDQLAKLVLLGFSPYVVVVVGARLENYWTPADRAYSSVLSFHLPEFFI